MRATAIKQGGSEFLFESFDLQADSWLREIEIFCGLPKTELFGHLTKYSESEVL